MTQEQCLEIISMVERLNGPAADTIGLDDEMLDSPLLGYPFEFSTNGYYAYITFHDQPVWCDEDDPREWLDENTIEPLEPFLRREARKICEGIIRCLSDGMEAVSTDLAESPSTPKPGRN